VIKIIRILEVPVLLLIMAIGCIEVNSTGTAIFLLAISVTRLIVNVITDEHIYRNRND